MHFVTPWITVADNAHGEQQRFLWRLTLRLLGAGDALMAARWVPEYAYGEPSEQIELLMEWDEDLEEDSASALGMLFIVSALLLLLLLYIVLRESDALEQLWVEEEPYAAYPPPAPRRAVAGQGGRGHAYVDATRGVGLQQRAGLGAQTAMAPNCGGSCQYGGSHAGSSKYL